MHETLGSVIHLEKQSASSSNLRNSYTNLFAPKMQWWDRYRMPIIVILAKRKENLMEKKSYKFQTFSKFNCLNFISYFSRSVVSNSATPWTSARQASLSITNSRSLLKLMSMESVMPSNHLILWHPLLLPPSIFSSIRVFSNESPLHIRWQ